MLRLVFFAFLFSRTASAETVHFTASDGVRIAANFNAPQQGKPVFILVHGLGAGKGEWFFFVSSLSAHGYGSLALDMRGHGQSGGPRYTSFNTPENWERVELDIEAATRFLKGKRVLLAGASIGANLVLRVAAKDPKIPFALLFSPGVDYRGVTTEEALRSMSRPLLLAASPNDQYAMQSCELLAGEFKNKNSVLLRAGSGHGVQMFGGPENQAFVQAVFDWIDRMVKTDSPSGSPASP